MNIDLIKSTLEIRFKISNGMFTQSRKNNYVQARSVFYALMRKGGYSLQSIAAVVGCKQHGTVSNGLEYFDYLYECDSLVQEVYEDLIKFVEPSLRLKEEIISSLDFLSAESLMTLSSFLKTIGSTHETKRTYIKTKKTRNKLKFN